MIKMIMIITKSKIISIINNKSNNKQYNKNVLLFFLINNKIN